MPGVRVVQQTGSLQASVRVYERQDDLSVWSDKQLKREHVHCKKFLSSSSHGASAHAHLYTAPLRSKATDAGTKLTAYCEFVCCCSSVEHMPVRSAPCQQLPIRNV
jgi:hypothetical protein